MCAQAIAFARIRRLYFGAYDPKRGAINSTAHAFETQGLNHRVEFEGGIMQGLGYALSEELLLEDGRVINLSLGEYRQAESLFALELAQTLGIAFVDASAHGSDLLDLFELPPQKRGADFARDVGRAEIDPGVFIDALSKEFLPVRSLVSDDFGTRDVTLLIRAQRSALTANDVLRFVETVDTEISDASERTTSVVGVHGLSGVLDHSEAPRGRKFANRVHLARHPRVVDR